ncbi:sushi, von Willebrand factor type A, EGF and pentraxin domain-containing protein 1-like isoform X2 [Halichondria panicea]
MSSLTRGYTGTPCVEDVVSITCTVPGALLEWNVPDPTRDLRVDETTELPLQRDQYTVISVVFNSTSSMITSSLSFPAVDGIIISCLPVLQPMLSKELTILTAVAPSPPNGFSDSILNSSANEISVSVQWDPPTETGGRDDLTYTVTVSPPTQLSATVLTSTSVTVITQYNVDYTISVVATNCAGNSTTAEYNFRISGCPVLTNPMNGAFVPTTSRLPGSTVTIQCDAGYVSPVTMVTCDDGLMWSPDPEAIECTSLPTLPPTSSPMNCTVQLSSPQNGTISDNSVPAIPGTQVTFQCNDGLFPEGIMTATCLATGEWDKNPGEIVCRNEPISCVLPAPPLNGILRNTTSQNTNLTEGSVITFQCDPGFSLVGAATVTCKNSGLWEPDPALLECVAAPIATGGVTGGLLVVLLFVLVVITLLVIIVKKRKNSQLSGNEAPKAPAGPVYEEVGLAVTPGSQDIQVEFNEAYGQTVKRNIEMQSNQAYREIKH